MEEKIDKLIESMKSCYQFQDQNMYQHGESVSKYFNDLINHLCLDTKLELEWIIPDFLLKQKDIFKKILLNEEGQIKSLKDFLEYCLYHDCGKPFCKTVDENGKSHFPEHEKVSYKTWIDVGGSEYIGQLILHDMDLHRMTNKELDMTFNELTLDQWCALIISSLAEVHSNGMMFGGYNSTSFKIKHKRISKNIKHLMTKLSKIEK